MPEYVERFVVEAYRSFGGTITEVRGQKGLWSINRVPPDLRQLPETMQRRFGKIGQTYPKLTFDKEQIVGYTDIEFAGPGHPLFEAIVEKVLRQDGTSLRQGACFYNGDATAAAILWPLKGSGADGRAAPI